MARRRKGGSSINSGEWLNTYADMVTLLLTFFIVMFSTSNADSAKWEILIKAFAKESTDPQQLVINVEDEGDQMGQNQEASPTQAEGQGLPTEFEEIYTYLKKYITENDLEESISIEKGESNVFIRFDDNIFFSPDSALIQSKGKEVLSFLSDGLKNVEEKILSIQINGHTAAVPGMDNYRVSDRILSTDRANSVLMYMEDEKKISPKKLTATGYGKNYPIASNDTEEGRKKNRRVDMLIINNEIDANDAEGLFELLQKTYNIHEYTNLSMEQGVESAISNPPSPDEVPPDLLEAQTSSENQLPVEETSLPAEQSST